MSASGWVRGTGGRLIEPRLAVADDVYGLLFVDGEIAELRARKRPGYPAFGKSRFLHFAMRNFAVPSSPELACAMPRLWTCALLLLVLLGLANDPSRSSAHLPSSDTRRTRLSASRQSDLDLEVGGKLSGLPAGTTRYLTRAELLELVGLGARGPRRAGDRAPRAHRTELPSADPVGGCATLRSLHPFVRHRR